MNIFLILVTSFLFIKVSYIENLIYSSEKDRGLNEEFVPLVNYNILKTKTFNSCFENTLETFKTNFNIESNSFPSPKLTLEINSDINLKRASYEIKQIDGVSLFSVEEPANQIYVGINRRDKLSEYAYWICFFQHQDFVKDSYYSGILNLSIDQDFK